MARTAGADAIELDVHETADGDLVVVHGFELGRTTDGVGWVHDHGVLDRVEFTSPHLVVLCELRRQAPNARVGLFARLEPYWTDDVHRHLAVADRDLLDAAVIHVPASAFDADWVDACHACGASAYAANADTVEDIRRVANVGADRLSTRDPGLAIATLQSEATDTRSFTDL